MGRGFTVWFTGLSGAGKTTLAERLHAELRRRGLGVELLDGDVVRTNLSKGLGFSKEDRDTNIRRIGFVCKLLTRNGTVAIASAISPYREVRDEVRREVGRFVEVYVCCPLEELVRRDVKGLYAKALRGEIVGFTGVSDPYEEPTSPEVVVHTDRESVQESLGKILERLEALGYLAPRGDGGGAYTTPGAVSPHGGILVDRRVSGAEREEWMQRARGLTRIRLQAREVSDLRLIATGGFSPLRGFLGRDDYLSVVREARLRSGVLWPMPVNLSVDQEEASGLRAGQDICLQDEGGSDLAVLHLEEVFPYDRELEAREVYHTTDAAHPGVARLYGQGDFLLGGEVTVLALPPDPFRAYHLEPSESRRAFDERGWRTIVGFQTRNPVHRAHEYIQKCALEIVDGLFLHPLVGETKKDDIPAGVRMRCYEVLLDSYYPRNRVVLSTLPLAMRYAGPREAVLHAIVRKNYGCTHFIVGRDHAGVGDFYGTYDAHRIFAEFPLDDLGIVPLFFDHAFYCVRCGGMASAKTCPHGEEERVTLSGTALRSMLQRGETPPAEFTRPEVAKVLAETAW